MAELVDFLILCVQFLFCERQLATFPAKRRYLLKENGNLGMNVAAGIMVYLCIATIRTYTAPMSRYEPVKSSHPMGILCTRTGYTLPFFT